MKVYFDIFTGDEIVSDSFKLQKRFEDVCAEAQARWIVKGTGDIDIGRGNEFGGKDDDDADGGVQDTQEKVLDLVDNFRLCETSFGVEDYKAYIKQYMKKVKGYLEKENPSRVATFMKGASEMVKWIFSNFKEFQFFLGEKMDMDAHVVLAYYKNPEDEAPTFVYLLDGLKSKTF